MVIGRDNAAELADHGFVIDRPGKLAIGTVSVNVFSKKHGQADLLSGGFSLLYTPLPQKAMELFTKPENRSGKGKQAKM